MGDKSDDDHNNADKHGPFVDEDGFEVGFKDKFHDPNVKWSKIELHVGEIYEPPSQLRFALTVSPKNNESYAISINLFSKCGI